MGIMDEMMEFMMGRISKEKKEEMRGKLFADMTVDDKKKMMAEMMPKMMEGINMMGMMSKMMGSGTFPVHGVPTTLPFW